MKIAVLYVTERGRLLSARIAACCGEHTVQRFCHTSHTDTQAQSFESLSAQTAALFPGVQALVFVCAAGIAVRMIAPHIRSKAADPAVLVMDDGGKYIIPLLSGHLGGANALAEQLAARLGALPVVTTASDGSGVFSPDSFAAANHLTVTDLAIAKQFSAALLDGASIGLQTAYPCRHVPPALTGKHCRMGIYIGTDPAAQPFPVTLRLIPKDLVIGIGCKRDIPPAQLEAVILRTLQTAGLDPSRLYAAASIHAKAEESAIVSFCEAYRIPLRTYSAGELMAVPGNFSASAFVMEKMKTDNVCERSAVLCSGGTLLLPKTTANGAAIAVAQRPVELDLSRERELS